MQTHIGSSRDLDFDRYVVALREAFADASWREEIERTLTANFYRWKYTTPYGNAVIASIVADGRLVSSAAAFPLMLRTPAGLRRAWQIGDLVTMPHARRRGLFRRSLAALVDELGPNDPLICFPNRLSLAELQSQGFHCVAELYASVRQTRLVRSTDSIVVGDSPPAMLSEAGCAETVCVCKDADYLGWRYARDPARQYRFISESHGSKNFGVVREITLPLGLKGAVVMELITGDDARRARVIKRIHQWARGGGLSCTFLFHGGPALHVLGEGYIPLPSFLQPKRHLAFMRFPPSISPKETANWRYSLQIGDWDGL